MIPALRALIDAARSERSRLAFDSPERQFYLGVEEAAREVLHPETAGQRTPSWLAQQAPPFRDGYTTALNDITAATTADRFPDRLRLPQATTTPRPKAQDGSQGAVTS